MSAKPYKPVTGTMVGNPIEGFDEVKIVSRTYPPLRIGADPPPWSHFNGTVVKLGFQSPDNVFRVTGSGVMVAPSTIVIARHVIEPELTTLIDGPNKAFVLGVNQTAVDIWDPLDVWVQKQTDLALMTLKRVSPLPPEGILDQVGITTRVPKIGESVMIAGFEPGKSEFSVVSSNQQITGHMYASLGTVTQVFPNGRDRFLLPWPCVEVAVHTGGAMSGGPAFDKDGFLFGVLCSCLDRGSERDDDTGPSYVSLVSPILSQKFFAPFPPYLGEASTLVDIANASRTCFIQNEDGR